MSDVTSSRLAAALRRNSPREATAETQLGRALDQLVAHPGKLIRGHLVLLAATHHGLGPRAAERLACGVEYFHTASLVLDDLPCMDDAALRRGVPCVHRTFGQATAILAALALINRAYALVHDALARQPRSVRAAANACLARALGTDGLVGGQAWDLAFATTARTAPVTSRIARQKTGALFDLAINLPAALARPTTEESRRLRALALYWGLQFQIADDLLDLLATTVGSGKTTGRDRALTRPNLALCLGVPAARARLARLGRQSADTLGALCAATGDRWAYLRVFPAAIAAVPHAASVAA